MNFLTLLVLAVGSVNASGDLASYQIPNEEPSYTADQLRVVRGLYKVKGLTPVEYGLRHYFFETYNGPTKIKAELLLPARTEGKELNPDDRMEFTSVPWILSIDTSSTDKAVLMAAAGGRGYPVVFVKDASAPAQALAAAKELADEKLGFKTSANVYVNGAIAEETVTAKGFQLIGQQPENLRKVMRILEFIR